MQRRIMRFSAHFIGWWRDERRVVAWWRNSQRRVEFFNVFVLGRGEEGACRADLISRVEGRPEDATVYMTASSYCRAVFGLTRGER
jgi:hypothetical protein